jgi:hypothetical protein
VGRQKALILDAITDHLVFLDPDLRILYINRVPGAYEALSPGKLLRLPLLRTLARMHVALPGLPGSPGLGDG